MVPIPTDHQVVYVPLSGKSASSRQIVTCLRRGSSRQPTIKAGLDALYRILPNPD